MATLKDTTGLLKQLIDISSVSGHETEILSFIENWLIEKHFDFVIRKKDFTAGRITGSQSKRAMILAGHVDTVVSGNLESWHFLPTNAVCHNGKLYGLGASDMKSGIAANMMVGADFTNGQLPYDLWIVATGNEELDGQGSSNFSEWFAVHTGYESATCIISEPSENAKINIGQHGNHFMKFHFIGKSGHGSIQENYGKSALSSVEYFLKEIPKILLTVTAYKNEKLNIPSIVPTSILAGDPKAPNKTAGEAELIVDIRTTPELDLAFDSWISELSEKYHFTWENIAQPVNSTLVDKDEPFIQTLSKVSGVTKFVTSTGSTDQGFFEEKGIHTVVFGPGDENQAHQANEYVTLDNIETFLTILTKLLKAI